MAALISIIIPIYKVEPYIRRCIDSVIRQTYSNLEIILVDDGSPDNCPAICDEYAQKDNRIKVIHKTNGGLSDTRNAGLDVCKGDYITFIDSDDWVAETFIETLYNSILDSAADIAICEFSKANKYHIDQQNTTSYQTYTSKEILLELFKCKHISLATAWCKLYKIELFKNERYPVGKFHEDEFVTYKLYYAANKICYIPQKLYYYFQRSDSIMATSHPLDVLEVLEQRYLFFKDKSDKDFLPLLLPALCWHLLSIYNNDEQNGSIEEMQKHLNLFKHYLSEAKNIKISSFHIFFLYVFSKFPKLYLNYRRYSPIHLRKDK